MRPQARKTSRQPPSPAWLIYGATGYTAGLIAAEAARRGLRPILGARDEARVGRLGQALGFATRAGTLDELERVLDGVGVVLHAAGPYAESAAPMAEACLRAGVHYLDLSGEAATLGALARRDDEARARGVMLLPSVGFDVVATNCLAAHVVARVRDARRLRIGIAGLDLISRGSARSTLREFGRPVHVRRDGALVTAPPASLRHDFDYGTGARASVAASLADLVAGYYATGIGDIETYVRETPALQIMQWMNRGLGWTSALPGVSGWLDLHGQLMPSPSEAQRAGRRAIVVVEVEDARGRVFRSRLETPEVYGFTVETSLAIVARVLRGDLEPGFQTPARVYGADFVVGFRGVIRKDLDVA